MRQSHDGKLVVPVLDKSGNIQSLQFIFPEKQDNTPDKLFQKGGRTAGGHFLIKADENDNEPLLIAEGYATAVSLHMVTGYTVMMAFSAGNLENVGKSEKRDHTHVVGHVQDASGSDKIRFFMQNKKCLASAQKVYVGILQHAKHGRLDSGTISFHVFFLQCITDSQACEPCILGYLEYGINLG